LSGLAVLLAAAALVLAVVGYADGGEAADDGVATTRNLAAERTAVDVDDMVPGSRFADSDYTTSDQSFQDPREVKSGKAFTEANQGDAMPAYIEFWDLFLSDADGFPAVATVGYADDGVIELAALCQDGEITVWVRNIEPDYRITHMTQQLWTGMVDMPAAFDWVVLQIAFGDDQPFAGWSVEEEAVTKVWVGRSIDGEYTVETGQIPELIIRLDIRARIQRKEGSDSTECWLWMLSTRSYP